MEYHDDARNSVSMHVACRHLINWYCQGSALFLLFLPVECTRHVLAVQGHLELLGAGSVKINPAAARSLARWRYLTTGVSALAVVQLTYTVIKNSLRILWGSGWNDPREEWDADDILDEHRSIAERLSLNVKWLISPFIFIWLVPVMVSGFLYTLRLGSALSRDAVLEVTKALKNSSPLEKSSWDKDVANPMLALETTMRLLSDGWSNGMLGLAMCAWLFALAQVCKAIDPVTCEELRCVSLRRNRG